MGSTLRLIALQELCRNHSAGRGGTLVGGLTQLMDHNEVGGWHMREAFANRSVEHLLCYDGSPDPAAESCGLLTYPRLVARPLSWSRCCHPGCLRALGHSCLPSAGLQSGLAVAFDLEHPGNSGQLTN